MYSSSKVRPTNPVPNDPVILLKELKRPDDVFFSKEPAPSKIPRPPSRGPLIKPS